MKTDPAEPQEDPEIPAPTKPPSVAKKGFNYMRSAAFITVGLSVLALATTFFIPSKNPSQSPTATPVPTTIPTYQLEINYLSQKMTTAEKNIVKMYENQQSLQKSLESVIANVKALQTETEQNRSYIATLYKKLRELELREQNTGGGFKTDSPAASLLPTDTFPQTP